MKNYRTLVELRRLKKQASEPEKIERLLQFIQAELGYALYQAVGRVKQDLSSSDEAIFRFSGNGIDIEQRVGRADFDRWIEPDLARMGETLDQAMREAGLRIDEIDRVFLTGGAIEARKAEYPADPTIRCMDLCMYLRLALHLYAHPESGGHRHGFERCCHQSVEAQVSCLYSSRRERPLH